MPECLRLNPGNWLQLYPIIFAGFDMEVMKKNIIHCVHRSLEPAPQNSTPPYSDTYSEKYSPISRVQMFQRYEERGGPNVEQATLSPSLQQRSRGDEEYTEDSAKDILFLDFVGPR